tara:strand:+ start:99 stop:257 length:159 start_codon:yes stop_codon:yes gene_type:complete
MKKRFTKYRELRLSPKIKTNPIALNPLLIIINLLVDISNVRVSLTIREANVT